MLLQSFTYSYNQNMDTHFFLPEVISWPTTKEDLKKIFLTREDAISSDYRNKLFRLLKEEFSRRNMQTTLFNK